MSNIFNAAHEGNFLDVKRLIESGTDVNAKNVFERTALHHAARSRSLEIVEYLVEKGASVNCEDIWNKTALQVAIESCSLEIVKYLVEHGAKVNYENGEMNAPLRDAVTAGSLEIIKYLVEHGAELKRKNSWETILHWACHKGEDLIVDYLLQHETMKDILDNEGDSRETPLSIACFWGHTAVVQTLLKHNVDIRSEEELICGNGEIIHILKEELGLNSIIHRQKIQILKEMDDKQLMKVGQPLKCFAADPTLLLGKGSMGTFVYVGIMEDGSEVAVKRVFIQAAGVAAENERRILSDLIDTKKSPFIVSYRQFLKDNTFIYLIVDLCEGTLKEHVRSLSIELLQEHGQRMIKEILTGLEFLHDQGILHRDLKPSNVLVDIEGHMRLADFGISRVLNENETTVFTDAKGTHGWMPAEGVEAIKKGQKCRFKKKSDVQVAGMIAFFILTKGGHPFGSSFDHMTNILEGDPVNLDNLVDLDARQFVSWLISHSIDDRPYAHEALSHSFIKNIKINVDEATDRPTIISWNTWQEIMGLE